MEQEQVQQNQNQGDSKQCKFCQSTIAAKAKRCPNCQADLRNFFARHKIITGILVIFVLGIIGTAAGGSGNQQAQPATSQNATSTTGKESERQQFSVGDKVDTGDIILTVTDVTKSWEGETFDTPKEGNTYTIIELALKNQSDQEVSVPSNSEFQLEDANGAIYDPAWLSGLDMKKLSDINALSAGGTAEANLIFEVDQEALSEMTLQYEPWTGKAAEIELQ